jgi:YVTN family beta-propeller protein
MKSLRVGAAFLFAALLAGCGGNSTPVGISISPTMATVVLGVGTVQFAAPVTGTSNTAVTWSIASTGSATNIGSITQTGLYTAPLTLPMPNTVRVTATAQARTGVTASAIVTIVSGVIVTIKPPSATIGTSETFQFTATVTGTTNTAVNFFVNGIAGPNTPFGDITPTGLYTAPASVPSPSTFNVTAVSAADPAQSASSLVTILTATDPTLSSIDITQAAQGSVFQDFYATGSNFFSTSTLLVNGTPIPTAFLSTTLLRGRIPSSLLVNAATVPVVVQRQNPPDDSAPRNLPINPMRPGVISSSPPSAPQGSGSTSISLDGGFYSPAGTTVQFNGSGPRAFSLTGTRQMNLGLSSADLANAGLFSLVVNNAGVSSSISPEAAVNLAVEPPASAIPSAVVNTITVGSQPTALALNAATNKLAVVNRGDNTVSLIDLNTNGVTTVSLPAGSAPTGVAVDNIMDLAVVVDSGTNSLSLLDMSAGTLIGSPVALPTGTTPFSIGISSLSHRALVANSSTNLATVVDLTTMPPTVLPQIGGVNSPISTGPTPGIDVEPRLNWAIVTPGGSGSVSIVDLGMPASIGGNMPSVIASLTLSTSVQGVAINPETEQAVLTDPNAILGASFTLFSVLDQTTTNVSLDKGEVAAAVNPLTNVGVLVNSTTNLATVVDLRTMLAIKAVPVGVSPQAVAIDPGTNLAYVANSGSGTVSVMFLGALRDPHLTQVSPADTFTSATPLTLIVNGHGFSSGSAIRLDGVSLSTTTVPSSCVVACRQLSATVPASMLAVPRRFVVDVQDGSSVTNTSSLTVIGAVTVGMSPRAVAVDPTRSLAVVTNSGDNTISIVDLVALTASLPVNVGASPQGVAVLPRLGRAAVTNFGSNNVSIVDYVGQQLVSNIPLPTNAAPLGVAINPDTATAVVANNGANSVSLLNVGTAQLLTNVLVDTGPVGVAIDPITNMAAVTASTQGTVDFLTLPGGAMTGRSTVTFQDPTGVTLDPVADNFIVANSLQNGVVILSQPPAFPRVGINPVSIDYDFQTSTLVTVNGASHTISVMDFLGQRVQAVVGFGGSSRFSVAINPLMSLAVVVDQNNNRVLLVPLPR